MGGRTFLVPYFRTGACGICLVFEVVKWAPPLIALKTQAPVQAVVCFEGASLHAFFARSIMRAPFVD